MQAVDAAYHMQAAGVQPLPLVEEPMDRCDPVAAKSASAQVLARQRFAHTEPPAKVHNHRIYSDLGSIAAAATVDGNAGAGRRVSHPHAP